MPFFSPLPAVSKVISVEQIVFDAAGQRHVSNIRMLMTYPVDYSFRSYVSNSVRSIGRMLARLRSKRPQTSSTASDQHSVATDLRMESVRPHVEAQKPSAPALQDIQAPTLVLRKKPAASVHQADKDYSMSVVSLPLNQGKAMQDYELSMAAKRRWELEKSQSQLALSTPEPAVVRVLPIYKPLPFRSQSQAYEFIPIPKRTFMDRVADSALRFGRTLAARLRTKRPLPQTCPTVTSDNHNATTDQPPVSLNDEAQQPSEMVSVLEQPPEKISVSESNTTAHPAVVPTVVVGSGTGDSENAVQASVVSWPFNVIVSNNAVDALLKKQRLARDNMTHDRPCVMTTSPSSLDPTQPSADGLSTARTDLSDPRSSPKLQCVYGFRESRLWQHEFPPCNITPFDVIQSHGRGVAPAVTTTVLSISC